MVTASDHQSKALTTQSWRYGFRSCSVLNYEALYMIKYMHLTTSVVILFLYYTSIEFLNITILLNIFKAGPSFIFIIFTMSDWVNNKNASPSIC